MQLDDFVSQTLKQIIDGVSAAQKYGKTKNTNINPSSARMDGKASNYTVCIETGMPLQDIEFDIAVSVGESNQTGGDGESIGEIAVTSANQVTNQSSSVSRIKFKVPILLPHSE